MLRTRIPRRVTINMAKIPRLTRPDETAHTSDRIEAIRATRAPHTTLRDQTRPPTPAPSMIRPILHPANRLRHRRLRRLPPAAVRAKSRLRVPSNKLATAARARPNHRHEPKPPTPRPLRRPPRRLDLRPAKTAPALPITPRGILTPAALTHLQHGLFSPAAPRAAAGHAPGTCNDPNRTPTAAAHANRSARHTRRNTHPYAASRLTTPRGRNGNRGVKRRHLHDADTPPSASSASSGSLSRKT
jgi:hypothetical protein